MDRILEGQLRQIVKPYLDRGRRSDYEHTLRTIGYARQLLKKEEGDEEIVIPALYLHDIGWSKVNYEDWINAKPDQKKYADSVAAHMRHGAEISKQILENLKYDKEKMHAIVSIIAIHDIPEQVFAMEDPSATMVAEADYLDRYGPESLVRFRSIYGDRSLSEKHIKEAQPFLLAGLELWFKTRTARSMAMNLAEESGLFA